MFGPPPAPEACHPDFPPEFPRVLIRLIQQAKYRSFVNFAAVTGPFSWLHFRRDFSTKQEHLQVKRMSRTESGT
jgi:hypothetical protein